MKDFLFYLPSAIKGMGRAVDLFATSAISINDIEDTADYALFTEMETNDKINL